MWVIARSDGFDEVTVQATLRTADQQSISVRSRGLVDRGRDATDNTRATPIFDTASARYAWLNRLVAVAAGDTHADRMRYQIYRIG